MRRTSQLLPLLLASLLLVVPVSAHAAKPKTNPWLAYLPAKGVTCTSTITHADGRTERTRMTVLEKSATKVVSRETGKGRQTSLLLAGGRMRTTSTATGRESGMRFRFVAIANYPSPARLLHHRRGSARMTMTMTVPKWIAKVGLHRGRTLTMTGTYRIAGLGSRSITLADPATTVVKALGTRVTLRSLTFTNARRAFARQLRKKLRPVFAAMGATEWIAKHRGTVLYRSTDEDGSTLIQKQVGCS